MGYRDKEILTVLGAIKVRRAYYYDRDGKKGFCPKDKALDVEDTSFSPGIRRVMGRVGAYRSEVADRHGKGEDGQAKTREVKLGCVFTQTTVDKEGRPVRDELSTSYVGAIETADKFGKRIYAEANRRGIDSVNTVCVISDGAP